MHYNEENDMAGATQSKGQTMSIIFKNEGGQPIIFKLKQNTPFSKAMSAYRIQQGVPENILRFYFDHQRIRQRDTPTMLEMQNGDTVEIHREQLGGGEGVDVAEEKPTHVVIRVKDQHDGEMEFRMKCITPMKKMMLAYCKTKEIGFDSVRFIYEGVRLMAEDTAESREMGREETVQAFLEQQGGKGAGDDSLKEEKKILEIRVKDQGENEVTFKVKKTTLLGKVMDAYCERNNKDRKAVRFLFDGTRVQDTDTPGTLDMEDMDVVEVFLEQIGGFRTS